MSGHITRITPTHRSSGVLQRNTCACGKPINEESGECDDCRKKREAAQSSILQRSALNGSGIDTPPPSVHETLRTSGQALDGETRGVMESRFGHDFSGVRVHADNQAARSAHDVAAHAYTVGQDVVFGAGEYRPHTPDGQRLIAHELAHVVQQAGSAPGSALRIEQTNSPAEAEAEQMAVGVSRKPTRLGRTGLFRNPTGGCIALLNRPGSSNIALGRAVEAAIKADFTARVGALTSGVIIESGSAGPLRTERPGRDDVIDPQIFSELTESTSGTGKPDLAFKRGRQMELAEVKPGNWFGFTFAEGQLARYLLQGNDDHNAELRKTLGISAFVPMTSRRYRPPRMMLVMGQQVNVMWCGPGVIVYKVKETSRKKRRQQRKTQKKNQKNLRRQIKKTGGRVGKGAKGAARKGVSRAAGRALAYAELAAAVILLTTGRAEASIGGNGSSALEALFESMAQNGAPLTPEMKKLIAEDKELQQLLADAAESGDVSQTQQAINDRILKMISENPDEFSEEDLKTLLESMQTNASASSAAPETVEQLRAAIDAAKAGKPAAGESPSTGTPGAAGEPPPTGTPGAGGGTQTPEQGKSGEDAGVPGGTAEPEVQRPRAVLSPETRKQIAAMPAEQRRFFDEWASGMSTGATITDAAVQRFMELVPQDLSEEETNKLISMLRPSEGKTIEEVLAQLERAVASVRSGKTPTGEENSKEAEVEGETPKEKPQGEKGGTEKEGVKRDEYAQAVTKAIQDYKGWAQLSSDEMRFVMTEEGRGFNTVRLNDDAVNIVIYGLQPIDGGGTRKVAAFSQCIVTARTASHVTIQLVAGAVFLDVQGGDVGTVKKGHVFKQSQIINR